MSSSSSTVELLARFPGPVTLYPSRKKRLLIFGWYAAFSAILIYGMILNAEWMGWLHWISLGAAVLVAAAVILLGAGPLRLDREGFDVRTLFGRYRARWQNVGRFEAAKVPLSRRKMVLFDDANPKGGKMATLAIAVSGHTRALPDTYGFLPDDLASLMAQWRARALI